MNKTDFRIKVNRFWRKHKRKIIIFLILWVVIILINYYLKNKQTVNTPSTTYEPHTSVLDDTNSVPEKLQEPIENLVNQYFNYCNKGEYENAYNMLTTDCKNSLYPTLDEYKLYIDSVFEHKNKIYNIQDYSNVNDTYIYNIHILDDILATGTTGTGYTYYEEKIVITNDNGNLKLAIGGYVGQEGKNVTAEDDYFSLKVTNVEQTYDNITYTIEWTNKTDYVIVLLDHSEEYEILLDLGEDSRQANNMSLGNLILLPGQTKTTTLSFTEFCDDGVENKKLILNAIRVLRSYTGNEDDRQSELDNAVKLYSLSIDV